MSAQGPSLLDLPDHLLEEITKHLDISSLTSMVQVSSKTNFLFRPRQTAMVCFSFLPSRLYCAHVLEVLKGAQ